MSQKHAKHSKQVKINYIRLITVLICSVLMIISGIHILKWIKENKKSRNITNKIQENIVVDTDNSLKVDFEKLKEENKDTVAWIQVKGTDINYPIVRGQNNDYYLTHSFDNSYNSAGWIFADYSNKFDGTDKNIVIFGHNRKDGSMFGTLKNILDKKWYTNEENKQIVLITETGNIKYEVFSVYKIENEEYYITTRFNNNDEFEKLINTMKQRSIYDFGNEVRREDKVLTLSTCGETNKYRVVLHAKKVD